MRRAHEAYLSDIQDSIRKIEKYMNGFVTAAQQRGNGEIPEIF